MSFLVISISNKVLIMSLDPSGVITTTIKRTNKWGKRIVCWIIHRFIYGCSEFFLLKLFYSLCHQLYEQRVRCLSALCSIGSNFGVDIVRNLENVTHMCTSSLSSLLKQLVRVYFTRFLLHSLSAILVSQDGSV